MCASVNSFWYVYVCTGTLGVPSRFVHAATYRAYVNEFLVCNAPMGPRITLQVVFLPLDPLCEHLLHVCVHCHHREPLQVCAYILSFLPMCVLE